MLLFLLGVGLMIFNNTFVTLLVIIINSMFLNNKEYASRMCMQVTGIISTCIAQAPAEGTHRLVETPRSAQLQGLLLSSAQEYRAILVMLASFI